LLKIHGILVCEDLDKQNEIVSIAGTTIKDHAPIVSASGNLLGRMTESQGVYRAITDESVTLAMKAGLVSGMPSGNDSNAISGAHYLELNKPFIKIKGVLLQNSHLKEAIKMGNLYFSIEGKVKERKGHQILACYIDKVVIGISTSQNCTKVFLDEN